MKIPGLILLFLTCTWVSVDSSNVTTVALEGVMMGDFDKLEFEGASGGTAFIEVNFDEILFCKKANELKITGRITSTFGEPYPYVSFVSGTEIQNGIDQNSKVLTSDSLGEFRLTIDYEKGEDLFIYGVGTSILKTRVIEK